MEFETKNSSFSCTNSPSKELEAWRDTDRSSGPFCGFHTRFTGSDFPWLLNCTPIFLPGLCVFATKKRTPFMQPSVSHTRFRNKGSIHCKQCMMKSDSYNKSCPSCVHIYEQSCFPGRRASVWVASLTHGQSAGAALRRGWMKTRFFPSNICQIFFKMLVLLFLIFNHIVLP